MFGIDEKMVKRWAGFGLQSCGARASRRPRPGARMRSSAGWPSSLSTRVAASSSLPPTCPAGTEFPSWIFSGGATASRRSCRTMRTPALSPSGATGRDAGCGASSSLRSAPAWGPASSSTAGSTREPRSWRRARPRQARRGGTRRLRQGRLLRELLLGRRHRAARAGGGERGPRGGKAGSLLPARRGPAARRREVRGLGRPRGGPGREGRLRGERTLSGQRSLPSH